jgi:hypothetical protein
MISRFNRVFGAFVLTAVLTIAALTVTHPILSHAQTPEVFSEPGFVSGTMDVDFGTRRNLDTTGKFVDGSPAEGAKDVYKLNLNVAKTTEYAGNITRFPRLEGKLLGREVQSAQLAFDVNLAVRNPKNLEQKKNVGKWVGAVTIGKDGVYDFGSGNAGASQLRIAVDAVGKAAAFVGPFSGKIKGKGTEKKGLLESKVLEYTRLVKGQKVSIKVKQSDPLSFVNLVLGEGPAQVYPRTTVNGNLDYDYDTGNWLTNGIHFKYTSNGVESEDVVTGSIKWVEDPNRDTNGKGQYEFNLRFNEDKNKTATDESAVFSGDSSQAEDAFFEVDNSIPGMTGTISYVDALEAAGEDEDPTVLGSKIMFSLDANKLTKVQAVNLFKLLMVIIGPMNDE